MMSIVSVSLALLFLIKLHCGASVNTIKVPNNLADEKRIRSCCIIETCFQKSRI